MGHRSRKTKRRHWGVAFLLLAMMVFVPKEADARDNRWSKAKAPTKGPSEAIGFYSAGCVRGAKALPDQGEGYERMRPARRRFFGHASLIEFLQGYSKTVQAKKLGPMLIGDLGQARGGPSPKGHASHQSGLDVDIWFWHSSASERRRLTKAELDTLSNHRIVDPKTGVKTKYWPEELETLLREAAAPAEVSKILVNPYIKDFLCKDTKGSRDYLHKIRPWYGHADHMHLRLHCPKGSKECKGQKAMPAGDGCGDLAWWFDKEAQAARKEGQKKYQKKVGVTSPLPQSCQTIRPKAPRTKKLGKGAN